MYRQGPKAGRQASKQQTSRFPSRVTETLTFGGTEEKGRGERNPPEWERKKEERKEEGNQLGWTPETTQDQSGPCNEQAGREATLPCKETLEQ